MFSISVSNSVTTTFFHFLYLHIFNCWAATYLKMLKSVMNVVKSSKSSCFPSSMSADLLTLNSIFSKCRNLPCLYFFMKKEECSSFQIMYVALVASCSKNFQRQFTSKNLEKSSFKNEKSEFQTKCLLVHLNLSFVYNLQQFFSKLSPNNGYFHVIKVHSQNEKNLLIFGHFLQFFQKIWENLA